MRNQTYASWELIICDDGSTDETLATAKELATYDSRIKVIRNDQNSGLAASLNHCLGHSRGEFIARMDGDDLCAPERLQIQVNSLDAQPDIDIVSTAMYFFDENGIWAQSVPDPLPGPCDLVRGTPFAHAAVLMRRSALKRVGGYSEDARRWRVEDYDLWVRMFNAGSRGCNIVMPLYAFRNDRAASSRRSRRARLNEARVVMQAARVSGGRTRGLSHVWKPLALAVAPISLYERLYRWKHTANVGHSGMRSDLLAEELTWEELLTGDPGERLRGTS